MKRDLEKATVAAQCAVFLCNDLKAMAVTDNLILSDVIVKEIEIAVAQRIRLERIAANLTQMAGDGAQQLPQDTAWYRDEEKTYCILLLVGGHKVTPDVVASWSDEQCKQAEEWALCTHVHASDNDDVEVPRVPVCVVPFMER